LEELAAEGGVVVYGWNVGYLTYQMLHKALSSGWSAMAAGVWWSLQVQDLKMQGGAD
jgi:hypothetical protein